MIPSNIRGKIAVIPGLNVIGLVVLDKWIKFLLVNI